MTSFQKLFDYPEAFKEFCLHLNVPHITNNWIYVAEHVGFSLNDIKNFLNDNRENKTKLLLDEWIKRYPNTANIETLIKILDKIDNYSALEVLERCILPPKCSDVFTNRLYYLKIRDVISQIPNGFELLTKNMGYTPSQVDNFFKVNFSYARDCPIYRLLQHHKGKKEDTVDMLFDSLYKMENKNAGILLQELIEIVDDYFLYKKNRNISPSNLRWRYIPPSIQPQSKEETQSPIICQEKEAPKPELDKEIDNQDECVICMNQKKCVILVPCNHSVFCAECWEVKLNKKAKECPICRGNVTNGIKYFP